VRVILCTGSATSSRHNLALYQSDKRFEFGTHGLRTGDNEPVNTG